MTYFGKLGVLKVRIKCFVEIILFSLFIVIRLTLVTPCAASSDRISSSVQLKSSVSDITPLEEFNVACSETDIWIFPIDFADRYDLACVSEVTSIKRSPDRNFLTDFGDPPMPCSPL